MKKRPRHDMNHQDINLTTFNCRGQLQLLRNFELFQGSDICALQECWLSSENLQVVNNCISNHHEIVEASFSDKDGVRVGRPYGGFAILWDVKIEHLISLFISELTGFAV